MLYPVIWLHNENKNFSVTIIQLFAIKFFKTNMNLKGADTGQISWQCPNSINSISLTFDIDMHLGVKSSCMEKMHKMIFVNSVYD